MPPAAAPILPPRARANPPSRIPRERTLPAASPPWPHPPWPPRELSRTKSPAARSNLAEPAALAPLGLLPCAAPGPPSGRLPEDRYRPVNAALAPPAACTPEPGRRPASARFFTHDLRRCTPEPKRGPCWRGRTECTIDFARRHVRTRESVADQGFWPIWRRVGSRRQTATACRRGSAPGGAKCASNMAAITRSAGRPGSRTVIRPPSMRARPSRVKPRQRRSSGAR